MSISNRQIGNIYKFNYVFVKPAEAGLISGGAFVKKPATEKPGRFDAPNSNTLLYNLNLLICQAVKLINHLIDLMIGLLDLV
jgi:hypothetical protein